MFVCALTRVFRISDKSRNPNMRLQGSHQCGRWALKGLPLGWHAYTSYLDRDNWQKRTANMARQRCRRRPQDMKLNTWCTCAKTLNAHANICLTTHTHKQYGRSMSQWQLNSLLVCCATIYVDSNMANRLWRCKQFYINKHAWTSQSRVASKDRNHVNSNMSNLIDP